MTNARILYGNSFIAIITATAATNRTQMIDQMITLNGKYNFSNELYGFPDGIAYRSDP